MAGNSKTAVLKAVGIGGATVGVVLGLMGPQASAAGQDVLLIKNMNSGKCLEIPWGQNQNGAPAQQWDCNGGRNQQWLDYGTTAADGRHAHVYRNVMSNKCLEVADWREDAGAPLRVWDCHWGANQKWVSTDGRWQWALVNENSGLLIDMPYASRADGTQAVQWYRKGSTDDTSNQEWDFQQV
ncbi:RICIN domain-containing protein [Streptomyces sp. NPDC093225]|uniref:RICIN domain-containing protein n=1 Tax=Streptomyces sp. NPDC093225 TaxID=3366034 RepID=UPI003805E02B